MLASTIQFPNHKPTTPTHAPTKPPPQTKDGVVWAPGSSQPHAGETPTPQEHPTHTRRNPRGLVVVVFPEPNSVRPPRQAGVRVWFACCASTFRQHQPHNHAGQP